MVRFRREPVPLSEVITGVHMWPAGNLYPTVPAALRAAMLVTEPAFLAANAVPNELCPLPEEYTIQGDGDSIQVRPLPFVRGAMGVDFAVAVALAQMACAARLARDGMTEQAAYFTEAAGLSAGAVCSLASCNIMEQMNAVYESDPQQVPWPEGILWPDTVRDWLDTFGIPCDDEGTK